MFFSIITPCYKSSKTLSRVYESLLAQSFKDFEWILVDDASPDEGETKKEILRLAKDAEISIKYLFLDCNHFASKSVYEGAKLASGKYACILDHDDYLPSNALEKVLDTIQVFNVSRDDSIAGVCGRCVNERNIMIGPKFKSDRFIANEGYVRFNLGVTCELFQFTKVSLIKDAFKDMKPGYTNGYSWAKISKSKDYVFVNSVIRWYDTANPESYTNNKSQHVRFPENKMDALLKTVAFYEPYTKYNLTYTFRLLASARRHSILANKNADELINELPWGLRFLYKLSYIPAFLKSKEAKRNN